MPKTRFVRGKLTKTADLFLGLWRHTFHLVIERGRPHDSRTVEKSKIGPRGQKLKPRTSPQRSGRARLGVSALPDRLYLVP